MPSHSKLHKLHLPHHDKNWAQGCAWQGKADSRITMRVWREVGLVERLLGGKKQKTESLNWQTEATRPTQCPVLCTAPLALETPHLSHRCGLLAPGLGLRGGLKRTSRGEALTV